MIYNNKEYLVQSMIESCYARDKFIYNARGERENYFCEQNSVLNRRIQKWKKPRPLLLVVYLLAVVEQQ
jgi:hypothetical protein